MPREQPLVVLDIVRERRPHLADREHGVLHRCDTRRAWTTTACERHINLHTSPEVMAGIYANFANVSHSDYEFTITFARVDHEVEAEEVPGVVVSRISVSPKFMRELIDAMEDNWSKWQTKRGHQEPAGGPPSPTILERERLADPLHGRRVRPEQERHPAGRVGVGRRSACAILRWNAISPSGSCVSCIEKRSARASTPRESWLEIIVIAGHDQRDRERHGRHRGDPAGAGAIRSASRATASIPNGATISQVEQPVRHVAVVHVAELVGDDEPRTSRGVKSFSSVS